MPSSTCLSSLRFKWELSIRKFVWTSTGRNTCQLCNCVFTQVCYIDTKAYCLFVLKHYVCSKNHTYCGELWFLVLYYIILQWQWKRLKSFHRDLTNEIHIQPFSICGSGSFVSIQWHSTMPINILLLILRANMLSDLSLYHSSEVYLHSSSNKV